MHLDNFYVDVAATGQDGHLSTCGALSAYMAPSDNGHYPENVVSMIIDNAPWVTIEPVTAPLAWRCTKVHLLEPEENSMKHNIFIDATVHGVVIRNASLIARWGWEGQRPDEYAKPAILDKHEPDHATDIPINPQQHIWVKIVDPSGYPSDIVRNLHADFGGPGGGADWHHQSYFVLFSLMAGDVVQPPIVLPAVGSVEWRLYDHETRLKVLEGK